MENTAHSFVFTATPADVALVMQLGIDGVFVGSGIFKSENPKKVAEAIVQAVVHYEDPKTMAEVSEDLGECMVSTESFILLFCCRFCTNRQSTFEE